MLVKDGFSKNQIRLIAKKSDRIVREYTDLYHTYQQQDNQRLIELLTPQQPGDDAKKKSILKLAQGDRRHE